MELGSLSLKNKANNFRDDNPIQSNPIQNLFQTVHIMNDNIGIDDTQNKGNNNNNN